MSGKLIFFMEILTSYKRHLNLELPQLNYLVS